MRQTFGNHMYTSVDGDAPSLHPSYHGSFVHSAAPAAVFTGYGSYHNAALAADFAMQNPHDAIAREIARKEYKRMKKISGRTITGQPLAIAPRQLQLRHPAHGIAFSPVFQSQHMQRSSHVFVEPVTLQSRETATVPMTFYSNPICPFAHRVWLSLLETQTRHEFKHVPLDPSGQGREWYTPIYRAALGADQDPDSFGAVPVLRDGEFLMAESAPIARYVFAKSAIKPSPEEDARTSIFMEQVGGNIIQPWYETLQAQTPEKQEEGKKNLLAVIKAISAAYERSGGPFFFGAKPSYADFHWFPWAHRIGVLQHYRGFSVPQSPEFAAYHRAVAAIGSLASSVHSARPVEFFVDAYKGYANPDE